MDVPADPKVLSTIGMLLGGAVVMWASSPFDVVLAFGEQPDGPWPTRRDRAQEPGGGIGTDDPPAIEEFLGDIRADIEELHSTRQLSRARELSARTGSRVNSSAC